MLKNVNKVPRFSFFLIFITIWNLWKTISVINTNKKNEKLRLIKIKIPSKVKSLTC